MDNANFFGYALPLGGMMYLTVEPNRCYVSIRKWYKPASTKECPDSDLKACRDGIMLSYDQFKKFVVFMQDELLQHFPDYATHVFSCNRDDHEGSECSMCSVKGLLPIQRAYSTHLATGTFFPYYFILLYLCITIYIMYISCILFSFIHNT